MARGVFPVKIVFAISLSISIAFPAFACDEHAKSASKPAKMETKRKIASSSGFSGADARLVYDGLPGVPEDLGDGGLAKEGEIICYELGYSFNCSVRGEDEETGKVSGRAAKRLFRQMPKDSGYKDEALGLARESSVTC